ncbi:hypothetical protein COBT_000701 [Conglomerata obtusa]
MSLNHLFDTSDKKSRKIGYKVFYRYLDTLEPIKNDKSNLLNICKHLQAFKFSNGKEVLYSLEFRASLKCIQFKIVITKHSIEKSKKTSTSNQIKFPMECISIYSCNEKKTVIFGRFMYFLNDKDRHEYAGVTQNFNLNSNLKNTNIIEEFISKLREYLNRSFCMLNNFFPVVGNSLLFNDFLCHINIVDNMYVYEYKGKVPWDVFSFLTKNLKLKKNNQITYFDARMSRNLTIADQGRFFLGIHKRFAIKKIIDCEINEEFFNSSKSIILCIKNRSIDIEKFYYIIIPITDLIYTHKIQLLNDIFLIEIDYFCKEKLDYRQLKLYNYIKCVVFLILFKLSPFSYLQFYTRCYIRIYNSPR